jgi:hypothetical protein
LGKKGLEAVLGSTRTTLPTPNNKKKKYTQKKENVEALATMFQILVW